MTSETTRLQKQLQELCRRVNMSLGDEKNTLLGKVKTIVDGAIADPQQRKAMKDLVDTAFWGDTYPGMKGSVYYEIEQFAKSHGIEVLFPQDQDAYPQEAENAYSKVQ